MEKRLIPSTQLSVSRACLGTMTFGAQVDQSTASRMLDRAAEAGINFLDTANVYNRGESERILGKILGKRRSEFVLASKVAMKVGDTPEKVGLSRAAILKTVEDSLRRLQTSHLDFCYLHQPDYSVPIEETLGAMQTLVEQGKVRHVATSNYAAWQICQLLWCADKNHLPAPRLAQPMYNLLARRIEDEFLPACRALGVATFVYNPLAGGLLTGKHTAAAPIPGSRFDNNKAYTDRYWNEVNHEAVRRLQTASSAAGRSLISVSLNWLLHHTTIDGIIIGASSEQQLEQNLAAIKEGALDSATLSECEAIWTSLRGASPKYNR
ncbi:MAG TPA: aldo/keto reductase [Opitutaceae bacterium]|nr:aldo/keto reductase [Opitutaceae bacterium]